MSKTFECRSKNCHHVFKIGVKLSAISLKTTLWDPRFAKQMFQNWVLFFLEKSMNSKWKIHKREQPRSLAKYCHSLGHFQLFVKMSLVYASLFNTAFFMDLLENLCFQKALCPSTLLETEYVFEKAHLCLLVGKLRVLDRMRPFCCKRDLQNP